MGNALNHLVIRAAGEVVYSTLDDQTLFIQDSTQYLSLACRSLVA